ncbi:hypothetical protein ACVPOS_05140 [Staphylococcus aureus]
MQQVEWKYEESNVDHFLKSPLAKTEDLKHQHPADYNVLAARLHSTVVSTI